MEFKQIKLIYFSPTGTTRRVLEGIAEGIAVKDVKHIDLTLSEGTHEIIQLLSDELVIIGAPVYGGRLPVEAINRFKQLEASNTLAILIVVYGNREFDDALLELKNIAIGLGFNPIAAGAFIGEHSFASKDIPIANGRPDHKDIQKAKEFGLKIKDVVTTLNSPELIIDLSVPGTFPYKAKGARAMAVAPVTKREACILCGTCADVCPTAAISTNKHVETNIKLCIRCSACIKNCSEGIRVWEDDLMRDISSWLTENCSTRKEPQIFGISV